MSFWGSLVFEFRGSLGDVDFDAASERDSVFSTSMIVVFAFLTVILVLNLLIAVMNEAYEETKETAEARWCYAQFVMLKRKELADTGKTNSWWVCCDRKHHHHEHFNGWHELRARRTSDAHEFLHTVRHGKHHSASDGGGGSPVSGSPTNAHQAKEAAAATPIAKGPKQAAGNVVVNVTEDGDAAASPPRKAFRKNQQQSEGDLLLDAADEKNDGPRAGFRWSQQQSEGDLLLDAADEKNDSPRAGFRRKAAGESEGDLLLDADDEAQSPRDGFRRKVRKDDSDLLPDAIDGEAEASPRQGFRRKAKPAEEEDIFDSESDEE